MHVTDGYAPLIKQPPFAPVLLERIHTDANQQVSGLLYSSLVNQPTPLAGVAPAGGNLPHENKMPYLTLNFCIAMQGVYPPRT